MNSEYVCPHCQKNSYHIIIEPKIIIASTPEGFVVDKDATAEVMSNNLANFDTAGDLVVNITKENQGEAVVICYSDECDGKELQFKDLILNEQARVESKCW